MEILFGLVILALLIWGLLNRKKHKKEWIKEERYEESGAWIDKRSGERGTYGSLDEEMESNRRWISMQGKVNELARNLQNTIAIQLPEYQSLNSDEQQRYFNWLKSELSNLFNRIEDLKTGKSLPSDKLEYSPHPVSIPLKKQVLDFSYTHFPELLQLDIEVIKGWDQSCQQWCQRILLKLTS